MTIQEKIDEVVRETEGALKECAIPEGDKERILNGVKELGFRWQEANAHGRAACVMMGLIDGRYSEELSGRFIHECVQFQQFDELETKETAGSYYLFRMVPMPVYAALIDMLMVQAIEGKAGAYQEKKSGNGTEKKSGTGTKTATKAVGTGTKTAAKAAGTGTKAATKKTGTAAKKATVRKSGGAADGK